MPRLGVTRKQQVSNNCKFLRRIYMQKNILRRKFNICTFKNIDYFGKYSLKIVFLIIILKTHITAYTHYFCFSFLMCTFQKYCSFCLKLKIY